MASLESYLEQILAVDASDLYLTAGSPPVYRVHGTATPTDEPALTAEDTARIGDEALTEPRLREEFARGKEMNVALSVRGAGRFRCNLFQQRGSVSLVIRQIKIDVPTLDSLLMPPMLADIVMSKRGLVLVVGATGSGKSTTLAAMIDFRNSTSPGHIITIEDPIEFIHRHKRSIVNQREVGFDTLSFHDALRNTLRQAPDVILIGEVRDAETMSAAITFAETGHLCLATLHSNNANQAIERILNFFPHERHPEILLQLSLNLRAVISQRLVPSTDGKRAAAVEVLIDTPRVKDLIKKAEVDSLKEAMEQGVQEGCQTFDEALLRLYFQGRVALDEALANADSPNNLRLRIRGEEMRQGKIPSEEAAGFRIQGRQDAAPPAAPPGARPALPAASGAARPAGSPAAPVAPRPPAPGRLTIPRPSGGGSSAAPLERHEPTPLASPGARRS